MDREDNGERNRRGLMSVFPSIVLVSTLGRRPHGRFTRVFEAFPSRIAEIILLADSKAAVTACLSVSYTQGEW